MGETPDISEWLDLSFYDPVWYWGVSKEDPKRVNTSWWLEVSHQVGSNMYYWILKENRQVIAQTTIQHITNNDLFKGKIAKKLNDFDANRNATADDQELSLNIDDNVLQDIDDMLDGDNSTNNAFAQMLNAQVMMPNEGNQIIWTVVNHLKNSKGEPIGTRTNNPFTDSMLYEVQMTDDSSCKLTYNAIAQNTFAQCDLGGHHHQLVKEVLDYHINKLLYISQTDTLIPKVGSAKG
eukprot:12653716-Ditylum_brightwellii.AAC.1